MVTAFPGFLSGRSQGRPQGSYMDGRESQGLYHYLLSRHKESAEHGWTGFDCKKQKEKETNLHHSIYVTAPTPQACLRQNFKILGANRPGQTVRYAANINMSRNFQ